MKAVRTHLILAFLAALGAGSGVLGCKGGGSSNRAVTGLPGGNGTGGSSSATTSGTTAIPASTSTSTTPPTTNAPPSTLPPPTTLAGVGVAAWHVNDDINDPTLKSNNGNEASLAAQVLVLVNQERANVGLAPLTQDAQAEQAAKAHAADMQARSYLGHGTLGQSWGPGDRMTLTGGSGFSEVGENVAVFQQTAQAVMTDWMNSTGHRANILNPRYTHLGVGVDEVRPLWCQVFLRRP
jgi:uncharacterized protein YkwD